MNSDTTSEYMVIQTHDLMYLRNHLNTRGAEGWMIEGNHTVALEPYYNKLVYTVIMVRYTNASEEAP